MLFVYGTLRPGFGHPLGIRLAGSGSRQGSAWVGGCLFDQGDYPVAVPDPLGRSRIVGELFSLEVGNALWAELDAYEDFDPGDPEASLFKRCGVEATRPSGAAVSAEIYWYRASVRGMRRIESGDYLKFAI